MVLHRSALKGKTVMRASIIDSKVLGNIFTTDDMRLVWSDENRTAKYLEVEKALASVQGGLGIIPREAADEIASNCDIAKIDMDKLRAQTERIGYPVLGLVSQLNALCRDKLGEYCHWGATTQDITDTGYPRNVRIQDGSNPRGDRAASGTARTTTASRSDGGVRRCMRHPRIHRARCA